MSYTYSVELLFKSLPFVLVVALSGCGKPSLINLSKLVTPSVATSLKIEGNPALLAGSVCGAYTVSVRDQWGALFIPQATVAATLSSTGVAGAIYSDSSCLVALAAPVSITPTASAYTFYFKGTAAGSATLSATATSLTLANLSITLTSPVSSLAIAVPSALQNVGVCLDITVNADAVTVADLGVALSATPAVGLFYSDAGCTSVITSTTILAFNSNRVVYYKLTTVGTPTVKADAGGSIIAGTRALNITGPNTLALGLTSGTQYVGNCLTLTATSKLSGSALAVGVDTALALSESPSSGTFYSDSGCSTSATSITVTAGTSSKVFYFKRLLPGAPTLTAASSGFTSGTVALNILGPTQLTFTQTSGALNTTSCFGLTVLAQDSAAASAPVIADTSITLTQSPSVGTFYSNSGCTTSATSATITTSSASTIVYYKTTTPGALTLTAASAGLTSGVFSGTIVDIAPTITYPLSSYTFTKDAAIAAITVTSTTGSAITSCASSPPLPTGLALNATTCQITGTPTVITASASYTITPTAGSVAGTGVALTLAVNAVAPTSIAIPTPSPTYTMGVAITTQTPTSTVTSGSPITGWTISPNLNTNTGLTFSTSTGAISGTATTIAATATTYTITASNSGGSVNATALITVVDKLPTVTYTGGPYSYQAGSTIATITPSYGSGGTVTGCTILPALPAGLAISSTCVVSGTVTGVAPSQLYTATPTNSGGTGSTTSFTLGATAAPPTKLALTGSGSYTTSYCAPYTVTVKDTYGNPSAVTADTTIALADASAGGAFYSDSNCTTGASSVIVTNGSSSALAYYKKPAPASVTLTSSLTTPVSPALTSATKSVTVTASTPARYSITGPSSGLTTDCLVYSVNVLDSSSNAVNATSTLNPALASTLGTYYSDSGCTAAISITSILSGASTKTVYFRHTAAATPSLTVSGTGMATSAALPVTITVGPALKIAFSTSPPAAGIIGGTTAPTCSLVSVQTRDANGNNNPPLASGTLDITFSATGLGGFYSNSVCTTSLPSNIASIATAGTAVSVYYKNPTASATNPGANIVITATASNAYAATATSTAFAVSSGAPYRTRAFTGNAVGQKVNSCGWVTLRVEDELGLQYTPALTGGQVNAINITGGGDMVYYGANQTCSGGGVTSVSMPTGTASATVQFSYKKPTVTTAYAPPATSAVTTTISWDNGGLAGATNTRVVTISSGLPDRLAWITQPANFTLGGAGCNSLQFGVYDENGTITTTSGPVTQDTTFSLSDGSDGTFYSSCTTGSYSTPISTVTVTTGNFQSAILYYNKPTAGSATITVNNPTPSSPALGSVTKAITVSAAAVPATKLAVSISPNSSLVSGSSCSLVTVQTQNASSTATNVTANSTYTMSRTNGALYYYDSACTASAGATPVISIANGANTNSTLYVANASSGSTIYTATYTSGTPAGLTAGTATVTYGSPAPTQLSLSGPTTLQAASGCGYYTISSVDGNAIAQNVASTKAVTVTSTGSVALSFYSDASCTTALGAGVSITSGTSSASFFARGMSAGSAQISTAATGLTGSADAVTVTP